MIRTYTEVGKKDGYEAEEIDIAVNRTKWEPFRTTNLPFCQGEALNAVISQCGIKRMDLHNHIKESHGLYALDVSYKNGQAKIYIADDGCETRVIASDFEPYAAHTI
jgi:hypothetical protein